MICFAHRVAAGQVIVKYHDFISVLDVSYYDCLGYSSCIKCSHTTPSFSIMLVIPLLTLAEQTSDIMQTAQQALKAKKFDQAIK